MKWHQQQGDDLVLVTASLSPYVKPLAASMGISSVLCSELVIDGSEFTGELAEGNCRGAEKARRLAQWLQNRHLDYAYGDSAGDDAMLALATTAVRVGRRDVVMASSVQ
jgi:phosphatidylglycerophosphatase C